MRLVRTITAMSQAYWVEMTADAESHSLRGAIDGGALIDFRVEFERLEPLASGSVDDPVNPTELRLTLDDGIGEATTATITVRWSGEFDYNIHYSDSMDRNLRWDLHPHDYTAPENAAHYHPPPDASTDDDTVEAACIRVTEVLLVARAVHQLWRAGYENRTVDPLNIADNSP